MLNQSRCLRSFSESLSADAWWETRNFSPCGHSTTASSSARKSVNSSRQFTGSETVHAAPSQGAEVKEWQALTA